MHLLARTLNLVVTEMSINIVAEEFYKKQMKFPTVADVSRFIELASEKKCIEHILRKEIINHELLPEC